MQKRLKEKTYACPYCKKGNMTTVPTNSLLAPGRKYWDSATVCTQCKRVYFKKVYPDGKVQTIKM